MVPTHPQRIRELGLGFVYVSFFFCYKGLKYLVFQKIPPRKRKVKRFEIFPLVDLFFFPGKKKPLGLHKLTFNLQPTNPTKKKKGEEVRFFLLGGLIFFPGKKNLCNKGLHKLYLQIFNPQIPPRKRKVKRFEIFPGP